MKLFSLCLAGMLLAAGCSNQDDTAGGGDVSTNNYSSGNPITAPTDYLGAVAKGQKNSVGKINLASIKQAVNLYMASEGKYPETLQQLVDEGYLGKAPEAPRGQQFNYNPQTGAISLSPIPQAPTTGN